MADNHPRVFLSATKADLVEHRIAAKNAIIDAGCFPVTMEHFAAESDAPLGVCIREVDSCDALVVLVAHRYGWLPPDQPEPRDKSITWLECARAAEKKLPVFAFLVDPTAEWDARHMDSARLVLVTEGGEDPFECLRDVRKLAEFRKWLQNGPRVTAGFGSTDSVRAEVMKALFQWRNIQPSEPVQDVTAARYVEYLREATRWIDLRGLHVGSGKAHRFEIEQLYVRVTTASRGMGMRSGFRSSEL